MRLRNRVVPERLHVLNICHILLGFLLAVSITSCEQNSASPFSGENQPYRIVAQGLTQPWSVRYGPDGFLWVTENDHFVSRIDMETGAVIPVDVRMPVDKGSFFAFYMHGLAFHTDFSESPYVYLSYICLAHGDTLTGRLDVIRMKYDSDANTLTDPEFFIQGLYVPNTMIVGGRLLTDGPYLYVCTADDRIEDGTAQDLGGIQGKVLRYYLDGSIPEDNPFPGSPVFTYGHRNPQGLVSVDGNLYSTEHGTHHNDEFNLLEAGRNYGWPNASGEGVDESEKEFINRNNVRLPLFTWTPTIAPGSLGVYRRNDKTYFLVTTLKEADIRVLEMDKKGALIETDILLDEKFGRLRDICVTPDGRIFISTFNRIQRNFTYHHTPYKDDKYSYDLIVELLIDHEH